MGLRNTRDSFGSATKWLHWIIALVMVGASAWAIFLVNQEPNDENRMRYIWGIQIHKSFGLALLLLIVARIAWVFSHPRPDVIAATPLQRNLAHVAHWSLYGLMILVPLFGWLASSSFGGKTMFFDLFTVPNIWPKDREAIKIFHPLHKYGSFALLGLAALHAGAALWHHYVSKDDTLRRMLPSKG